jgi:hypothetical protein
MESTFETFFYNSRYCQYSLAELVRLTSGAGHISSRTNATSKLGFLVFCLSGPVIQGIKISCYKINSR